MAFAACCTPSASPRMASGLPGTGAARGGRSMQQPVHRRHLPPCTSWHAKAVPPLGTLAGPGGGMTGMAMMRLDRRRLTWAAHRKRHHSFQHIFEYWNHTVRRRRRIHTASACTLMPTLHTAMAGIWGRCQGRMKEHAIPLPMHAGAHGGVQLPLHAVLPLPLCACAASAECHCRRLGVGGGTPRTSTATYEAGRHTIPAS